jgi:hypothetical protein
MERAKIRLRGDKGGKGAKFITICMKTYQKCKINGYVNAIKRLVNFLIVKGIVS